MQSLLAVFARRTNLFSIILCLVGPAGCSVFDVVNAPVLSYGYTRTSDIGYGSILRQKLDVYRPRHAAPSAPVVIFFYGGDWREGQKGDYRFAAEALTSRGFVAVLPDYRLYPEARFPQFIEDGALAVRWTHEHINQFGGDPTRIYLMGHSAGAYIAAMLTLNGRYLTAVGLDRSVIRGTVALAGPYDFQPHGVERDIFNMTPGQERPDPQMQVVNAVDGHAPPMLLIQGLADELVDPVDTFELAARIRNSGGDVEVISYPERGHKSVVAALAWEFRWVAPVLRDSVNFLKTH